MTQSSPHPRQAEIDQRLAAGYAAEQRGELVSAQFSYVETLLIDADNDLARQRLAAIDSAMAATYQELAVPEAQLRHLSDLRQSGRLTEALSAAQTLFGQYPQSHVLHEFVGSVLYETARFDTAIRAFLSALMIKPDFGLAHYNLAGAYQAQARHEEALGFYLRANALAPDNAEWLNSLAKLYVLRGCNHDAIAVFERVLQITPDDRGAAIFLALACYNIGNIDKQISVLSESHARHPDCEITRVALAQAGANACDWTVALRPDELATIGLGDTAITPFAAVSIEDHPEHTLHRTRLNSEAIARAATHPTPATPLSGPRLRIGYFSADFRDHATMYLMSGVFREHDRQRFEIHAYGFSALRSDEWAARLREWCDGYHDVLEMTDAQVVALARSHNLDLAIDLKGYTQEARTSLFAHRMAPVQVQYLGFPGSMAAPFFDYMVADRTLVPPEQRQHYSESVIYLPGSYQANDNQRVIASDAGTRADHGLPADGLVFGCFNTPWKIGQREFAIWLNLLDQVPGSVLWLYQANATVSRNLRQAASARAIDPDRLVFAPYATHASHLARLAHADLVLDTFVYNAHTTGSDALWAGVPVLTMAGKGFAARVCASLLNAVGLPELITGSPEAYQALALTLAHDRPRLAALRQKLATNRLTTPLFDTPGFTRNLETAWATIIERSRAGAAPEDVYV